MIEREDFMAAYGEPGPEFNRALDDALRRVCAKEARPIMKRKISAGLLAAIIALLTLTGAALAVGLNLFDVFGRDDGRLAQIASQTALETATPAEVASDELGQTSAAFDSAYYDGNTLIAAYTVDNYVRYERFEPTPGQLAGMNRLEEERHFGLEAEDDFSHGILDEFAHAVDKGEAFGYVQYTLEPGDHCLTDDGIDLPPATENRRTTPEGQLCCIREFETPLPEAARDRDSLTIRMKLKLYAAYTYFDGADCYVAYESRDAGEIAATASRADARTRHYAGEGLYNGVPLRVEATASAVHAALEITAGGEAFPDPATAFPEAGDDLWYWFALEDETGAALNEESESVETDRASVHYCGSGRLPEQLRLHIIVEGEGDWDAGRAGAAVEPILLEPVAD